MSQDHLLSARYDGSFKNSQSLEWYYFGDGKLIDFSLTGLFTGSIIEVERPDGIYKVYSHNHLSCDIGSEGLVFKFGEGRETGYLFIPFDEV